MSKNLVSPELLEAKRFHGHLGPYLVVGMRMGNLFVEFLGDKPFSYRIHATVGWKPPPSCVIDGLQITTPCTVGNSMIRIEALGDITAWALKDGKKLSVQLHPHLREKIDLQTTKENEESFAQELWEMPAAELFNVEQPPP